MNLRNLSEILQYLGDSSTRGTRLFIQSLRIRLQEIKISGKLKRMSTKYQKVIDTEKIYKRAA